jgi:hypothetical protein
MNPHDVNGNEKNHIQADKEKSSNPRSYRMLKKELGMGKAMK